jgi:hypothetical protein
MRRASDFAPKRNELRALGQVDRRGLDVHCTVLSGGGRDGEAAGGIGSPNLSLPPTDLSSDAAPSCPPARGRRISRSLPRPAATTGRSIGLPTLQCGPEIGRLYQSFAEQTHVRNAHFFNNIVYGTFRATEGGGELLESPQIAD